nr:unnamed protein product [Callosobruchus chinensis]
MMLAPLVILCLAYGFSGTWWIQDTYSESGIPPGPCMRLDLTVSPEYKFRGVHSWRENHKISSMNTPEVDAPPDADPSDTKIIYVRIRNDTVRGWFLGVDYHTYGTFYGCTGDDVPFLYLWTRKETRDENVVKNVTALASRRVILPKHRRTIDHNHSTCKE